MDSELLPSIISITFAFVGLILIFFSLRTVMKIRRQKLTWIPVTGTLVGVRYPTLDSDSKYFIIQFITQDGEEVKFENRYGSNMTKGTSGVEIPVLYNPSNPSDAVAANLPNEGWLHVILFGIIGIIFGSFGIMGCLVIFELIKIN